jgi:hypothetical protein
MKGRKKEKRNETKQGKMGLSKAWEALATKLNHTKISIHVSRKYIKKSSM